MGMMSGCPPGGVSLKETLSRYENPLDQVVVTPSPKSSEAVPFLFDQQTFLRVCLRR